MVRATILVVKVPNKSKTPQGNYLFYLLDTAERTYLTNNVVPKRIENKEKWPNWFSDQVTNQYLGFKSPPIERNNDYLAGTLLIVNTV